MTLRPSGPAGPPATPLLDALSGPDALRAVPASRLPGLAAEIRGFMTQSVSRADGHLGPDLGVVELTLALHRVFDAPRDRLVWDTGRQAYAHELLTGRRDFTRRRHRTDPTWYAAPHGAVDNARTGAALSYADGFAKAHQLRGLHDRHVVAVIDSEALTCGMAWEALNNLATARDLPLVIVIHDSTAGPATAGGGLADHLATLRAPAPTAPPSLATELALDTGLAERTGGATLLQAAPAPTAATRRGRARTTTRTPRTVFDDLGFGYFGPVDGLDAVALEIALRRAKALGGPAVVHSVTGRSARLPASAAQGVTGGDGPAAAGSAQPAGALGGPAGPAGPTGTGGPAGPGTPAPEPPSWTSVFSEEMVRLGAEREDVVGITA
ncbi:1-deoxy-D-xylulose-5-phosphate synthase N-terminal domain-containing protein, partial [Streptomyces sp. HSW2009]|uniref:1-deoxy-D-xylulose-5-phosphate synthase N-terminal domain-containing protein n=1 Tax=Streptomyces sp. HSW2009 TaxID=3142890 RepID=UPI0032F0843A